MRKQTNPAYRTAHFGKWDMWFDEVTPEEVGYDFSDGYTGNGTGGGKGTGGPAAKDDPKLIFGITDRASDFIETQTKAGHPFFVQVSHYAVHLDIFYRAKTSEQTKQRPKGKKHTMPEFAAMTSDVDSGIGTLIDKIKSLGLQDNTYIFFLSDNARVQRRWRRRPHRRVASRFGSKRSSRPHGRSRATTAYTLPLNRSSSA